jgi:hypothetical protein
MPFACDGVLLNQSIRRVQEFAAPWRQLGTQTALNLCTRNTQRSAPSHNYGRGLVLTHGERNLCLIAIAENASIDDGKTVVVFSLEMAKEALVQRMLCSRARVDSHRMRTGTL